MSDAMDKAFETMMIESINGASPETKFKKAHVAKFLRTERKAIKAELREEKQAWLQEQKDMTAMNIAPSDPAWVEAKELYELNRKVCMQDMEDLRKMI